MLNVDDYIYKKIEHFFVFLFVCFGFFLGGGEVWVDKKGNNKPGQIDLSSGDATCPSVCQSVISKLSRLMTFLTCTGSI
jgi:hypothetical protein